MLQRQPQHHADNAVALVDRLSCRRAHHTQHNPAPARHACRLTAAAGPGAAKAAADGALIAYTPGQTPAAAAAAPGGVAAPQAQKAILAVINDKGKGSAAVSRRLASKWPKPAWHPPWKCYRVISGHLG